MDQLVDGEKNKITMQEQMTASELNHAQDRKMVNHKNHANEEQ